MVSVFKTLNLFEETRHRNHQEKSSMIEVNRVDDCREAANKLPNEEFGPSMVLGGLVKVRKLRRAHADFRA